MTSWRLWVALLAATLGFMPMHGPAYRNAEEQPVQLAPIAPVLYVVGPATGPACGGVGLVALLAPAAVGDNAATFLRALGPVFTLCGAVPPTPAEDRYACNLDAQALEVVGAVTGAAGVPPALDVRPVGQLLETLGNAGAVALTKPRMNELLRQPSVVLQCTRGTPSSPEPTIPPSPDEPAPEAAPERDVVPPSAAVGDDQLVFVPLPAAPVPSIVGTERPAAVTTPFGRVPFSYAAVFVLPFLLLVVMGAIGSSLLRPLDLDPSSSAPTRRFP